MKKVLSLLVAFAAFSPAAFAAPMPTGIPVDAGAINVHDTKMLKERQEAQKAGKEFERIQKKNEAEKKQKKSKKKGVADEPDEAAGETPVIKAKIKEYKTKGVYVENVEISSSSILSEKELNYVIKKIKGKNVHFEQLEEAVNQINYLYASKGYVTARAILPTQTVEKGVVKIELIEGKVGRISINGNRWTRSSYINKRLNARTGEIFNVAALERDLVKFNRYNDGIKLSANLFPGKAGGTTDIVIDAQETFPYRITGLFDNAGRKTIGEVRGGLLLNADSLFGVRDRLTVGAYKSQASFTPYADYNIPVNKYDGRVGATFSMSHSEIVKGPYAMFNIGSRSYNYSLYYTHPLVRKPFFELTGYAGINYKQATTSFDKFDLYTDKITSAQLSLYARYDTKRGIWYAHQGVYQAFPLIDKSSKYLKVEGGVTRLHDFSHGIVGQFRANYQVVPQDVIPYVDQYQAGGIASVRGFSEGVLIGKSGYLISAELLFPILPKTIKIRTKGKGDEGITDVSSQSAIQKEVIAVSDNQAGTEVFSVTTKKHTVQRVPFLGKYVKGLVFIDHAGVFPFKGKGPGREGISAHDTLTSIGAGLRVTLPKDFTARLYMGYPLIHNLHEPYYKSPRFHFELSLAPDFDAFLKMRKRRAEAKDGETL